MIADLNTYLLQNKSISIPGVGTVYVERKPAQSDFINRQILPPSFHYRFDKYFDAPEKDFFSYLAACRQVADYEAIQIYNQWAQEMRNEIRNNGQFIWPDVGVFTQDLSGDIRFEPEAPVEAYLQSVAAERVLHSDSKHIMLVGDREVTNLEMSEYLNEGTTVKKQKWWLYAAILALIAIIAIFLYFNKTGSTVESTANQQKVLSD